MTTAVCVLGLLLWFVLSVLVQFKNKLANAIKSRDGLSCIPIWTFFAPNPGIADVQLLYRDVLCDDQLASWQEMPGLTGFSIPGLWNPKKRAVKCLGDMVGMLQKSVGKCPTSSQICLTIPYVTVLQYVSAFPRPGLSTATQFVLLKTKGYHAEYKHRVVFISNFHALCPSPQMSMA